MKFVLVAALPLTMLAALPAHAAEASVSRAVPPDSPMAAVAAPAISPSQRRSPTQTGPRARAAAFSLDIAVASEELSAGTPSQAAKSAPIAKPVVAKPRPAVSRPRGDADEVRCVAQAVFHEARGEPERGQKAVADVVMNRARSGRWGGSACGVVNARGQFSNRWSWRAPQAGVDAWDHAVAIARDAVSGAVGVSTHLMNFRAAHLGGGGIRALRIGNHVFW